MANDSTRACSVKPIIFWILIVVLTFVAWGWIALPVFKQKYLWKSRWLWIVLGLFPVLALTLYIFLGNWRVLENHWRQQALEKQVQNKIAAIKDPQQLIDELKAHLQEKPKSAEGWFLLGKLYLTQGQSKEAENALQAAYQLAPNQANYLLTFAEAYLLNHQNRLSPALQSALSDFLKENPNSVTALNFLAIHAYETHRYHQAVQYWQQALSQVEEGSPDSENLLKMISVAQKKNKILFLKQFIT